MNDVALEVLPEHALRAAVDTLVRLVEGPARW